MDATLEIAGQVRPTRKRWGRDAGLLIISIACFSLALAPYGIFPLAYFCLVPWLFVVRDARSGWRAFWVSWIAGTLFFTANMWWMANISFPGMVALMIYCGIYWGAAAWLIRANEFMRPRIARAAVGSKTHGLPSAGFSDEGAAHQSHQLGAGTRLGPIACVLAIAAVWAGLEWLRSIVMTGLPWLYLGHTQTPALVMCQTADFGGVYFVSFSIIVVNATIAMVIAHRKQLTALAPAIISVAALLAFVIGYGVYRLDQNTLSPGPTILVVQPNYPQTNNGDKGADDDTRVAYHLDATRKALAALPAGSVDLAVWSETMMPPLNSETRDAVDKYLISHGEPGESQFDAFFREICGLAADNHITLLAGGEYATGWRMRSAEEGFRPDESRNSAFAFGPDGSFADGVGQRYDKIHLVPFGEFIPFKGTFIYDWLLRLGPPDMKDYELEPGAPDALTVFHLRDAHGDVRYVTPICFEDIDARICAAMMRPGADGKKRADLIVNLTNDGWFKAGENAQHFQAAQFRCIENRTPMARSVNTGISGFIDSNGRAFGMLDARTEGTSVHSVMLDSRLTFYTCYGDLFAGLCVAGTVGAAAAAAARKFAARPGLG